MQKTLSLLILLFVLTAQVFAQTASQQPSGTLRVSTSDGSVSFEGIRELVFPANQVRITGRKATVFSNYGIASSDVPNLDASKITSGIFNSARLGTGTANSSTFLRGDGSWSALPSAPVSSVFGRTGVVVAASGDYTTSQVTEGSNLYYTDARARGSLSAVSPLSFNNGTGVFSIQQASGSQNGYLSSTDWATFNNKQPALGYTPLNPANNLSDVASASTSRTNLGLGTVATRDVPASGNASSTQVVKGDDTRLSDARTPTTHTHAASDLTSGTLAVARLPVFVGSGASHAAGIVPDPGSSAGTSKFLREDATWVAPPSAPVTSVFGRTGAVVAATNDYTWSQIDKTTSSLADLTTRSASDLTSGTLPDARFPATLPSASGTNLTNLNASNLASGTVPAARLPQDISSSAIPSFASLNLSASSVLAWGSGLSYEQIGGNGSLMSETTRAAGNFLHLSENTYFDGSNWKYTSTDFASNYYQNGGSHNFRVAASGTAGASVTWTRALTIDANANIVPGNGALSTSANNGFQYWETTAGAPTGTPTSYTGRTPYVYDTTNHRLYVYDGGSWRFVQF